MRYLSVCSGIEAASLAWAPLGWVPLAFAEIEAFPRAVLEQRFPGVRLEGDFTLLRDEPWIVDADILVGGTPCQDFSIAGLRAGMAGDRGNLTLEFLRLANAIDALRLAAGRPGVIVLWENVAGVFSHADNPFGTFLGALVGADAPLVPATRQRWTDAGLVAGPRRTAAWRVLDAQFFGLAQRRERVFVVAGPRDGPNPAAILFEPEGVRGNPPPRRAAGQAAARPVAGGSPGSGGWRGDADTADSLIAHTIRPPSKDAVWRGDGADNLIADTVRSHPRPGSNSVGLLAFGHNDRTGPVDIAGALNGHGGPHGRQDFSVETFIAEPVAFTQNQREEVHSVVGFSCKDSGQDSGDIAPTLRAMNETDGNANAGGQVAIAFDTTQGTAQGHPPAIAARSIVRRLTPTEYERLQGMPDGWTLVQHRGKPAKDGPRYRAIGNSMATPVMAWIGRRIAEALS